MHTIKELEILATKDFDIKLISYILISLYNFNDLLEDKNKFIQNLFNDTNFQSFWQLTGNIVEHVKAISANFNSAQKICF